MTRYGRLLADAPQFVVPTLDAEFTTARVLAMSFVEGVPVETLVDAPQETRDGVMHALVDLVLRECFEFGMMQTDPNFANYRYQPESGRLVLLDFGAAQPVRAATAGNYRALLLAGLSGDHAAIKAAAVGAGILTEDMTARHGAALDRMIDVVVARLNQPGPLDFGDRAFVGQLREDGTAVANDRAAWHLPPADMLFVQRKISGTALLAARLKARVDVRALVVDRLG